MNNQPRRTRLLYFLVYFPPILFCLAAALRLAELIFGQLEAWQKLYPYLNLCLPFGVGCVEHLLPNPSTIAVAAALVLLCLWLKTVSIYAEEAERVRIITGVQQIIDTEESKVTVVPNSPKSSVQDETASNFTETCLICKENKRIYALVRCGHLVACVSCKEKLKTLHCPVCKTISKGWLRIFY